MDKIKKLVWLFIFIGFAFTFILGCKDVSTTIVETTSTTTLGVISTTTSSGKTSTATTTAPITTSSTISTDLTTVITTAPPTVTTTVPSTLSTAVTTTVAFPEPTMDFSGETGCHTIGLSNDLVLSLDLGGADITELKLGTTVLAAKDYRLSDDELTIFKEFIDRFQPSASSLLKLTTGGGTATLDLVINDIPDIKNKSDFIKFPGEAIVNEDFRGLVIDEVGALTYEFSIASDDHLLVDHGNGTFDFTPGFVFVGDLAITFKVTDEYGAGVQRDINLNYKEVDPYIFDAGGEKTFEKMTAAADLVMMVNTYGSEPDTLYYEMTDVLLSKASIGSDNYLFKTDDNPKLFSLKYEYLMALPVGIHTFTLTTEAGQAEFIVNITDSRPVEATPNEAEYTLGVSSQNLDFALVIYNNQITGTSFELDGTTLLCDEYTYSDQLLSLQVGFLETLTPGNHRLSCNGTQIALITILTPQTPKLGEIDEPVIFEKTNPNDLVIPIELHGFASVTDIFDSQVKLETSAYSLTETTLTIKKAYLSELAYGNHEFFIVNSQGSASFFVAITDKPKPSSTDQNVTKFTYETISSEALRVLQPGGYEIERFELLSVGFYNYVETASGTALEADLDESLLEATGGFGSLTISETAKAFAFIRNSGWYGVVVFTYVALDELGLSSAPITMEVVYKPMPPAIADSTSKHYVKGDLTDVVYTVTNMSGNSYFPIEKIFYGETELVLDSDYTVGPQEGSNLFFTIKATYLETLSLGTKAFLLRTGGGQAEFSLEINSALNISDPDGEFDKNIPETIVFAVSGQPNVIQTLKKAGTVLPSDHYTFTDGSLSIKSTYLNNLPYGEHHFTINNGYGESELKITVMDSRTPVLVSETITYYEGSLENVSVAVNLYDKSVTGLLLGETEVSSSNYSVFENTVTLTGPYLESVGVGREELAFTIVCSEGSISFTVLIEIPVAGPTITQISPDFKIDTIEDVTYSINLSGNTFTSLRYQGIVLTEGSDYTFNETTGELVLLGEFLIRLYNHEDSTYGFTLHTLEAPPKAFSLTYQNSSYLLLNGGFETGDLFGWAPYALWKDEAVLTAFRNERVVDTLYYGSAGTNLYNKDGTYHFGLYIDPYDNANKDLNQERMGMLRSENFTLSGSGVISFKLGGGKNTATAYIAIHDASNNQELARFGNRHFGNTALSGTENAEGYMFQYYYDLSEHLGKELYFLIVDSASHEWNVLAFDSFITYYIEKPTYNADETAQDIKPTIYAAGAATNQIINGALTANLDNWENPNGVFKIDNGGAISSHGGNAALGALRSPAFTVNGANVYLTYEFAGAIQRDKQVFILIKEVGTNLEVLRLTRRADQASSSDSGDFKPHWYDLSGLDPLKEYYLEIIDNRDGEWGVALVRNINLVSGGYGADNQAAVNAFYGLNQHDPETGMHWKRVSELEASALAIPHFVIATLGENASSGFSINYHSPYETTYLEYTQASDPTFANASRIKVTGALYQAEISETGNIVYGFTPRYVHKAAITGLDPNAEYIYRIREGYAISEVKNIKTAPLDSYRFLYYTDTQAENKGQTATFSILIEEAYLYHDDYLFALVTGDLVEKGVSETMWDWFYDAGPDALPLMTVPGNHDYQNQAGEIVSAGYYNSLFNNPQNGSSNYLNSSYYFLVNNTLYIMLDTVTGTDLASQQAWLIDTVTANPSDFVIVATHYSMYGTYHEPTAAQMISDWLPTFDSAGVDLVLSGHDHIYARTPKMAGGIKVTEGEGTYYLIGGTAGYKYRYVEEGEGDVFEFFIEDTISTISMIEVSAAQIAVQTIDTEGTIVDSFTIPA